MFGNEREKSRALVSGLLARVPGTLDTGGLDLKRYAVWVTTACLWGLALTAVLCTALPALRLPEMNPGPTYAFAALTMVVGAVVVLLPWHRWGSDAVLIMGIVAVPYLVTFNHLTNYTATTIGVGVAVSEYFCTLAICGLTQRRGIPLLYGIYEGAIFFVSSQLTGDSWVIAVSPVLAIPFTAMVGETIAWTVGGLRDARQLENQRVTDLQNLSRSVAQLRTDIPVDQAAETVVSTARELLRGVHAQLILRDEPLSRVIGDPSLNETMTEAMRSSSVRVHHAPSGDVLVLPLAGDSTPWGAIVVWFDRPVDDFTRSLADLLKMEAGTALDQLHTIAALTHDATIDTLTGIGNRRLAEAAFAHLLPGDALVLVDLDKLKPVNDTLGHAAGDDLICALAACLSSGLREADVVARLGGDEFVWIAKGVGEHAKFAGTRLREQWICTQPLSTVSVGIALHLDGASPSATLACADTALYMAKEAGGDRVELYVPLHDLRIDHRAR